MGGDWQDLGGALHGDDLDFGVTLQPLARLDEAGERAWAAEWLAAILASEGVLIDPVAKEHLWSALRSLVTAPVPERTLPRSDEHTSEHQSLMRISYAVFCLTKKKKIELEC